MPFISRSSVGFRKIGWTNIPASPPPPPEGRERVMDVAIIKPGCHLFGVYKVLRAGLEAWRF